MALTADQTNEKLHPELTAAFHQLSFYTLAQAQHDPRFIHQHIVDAHAAQTATEETKPVTLIFALAGLYLFLEKNYTGKEVQQFHQHMAEHKRPWPKIDLPAFRGSISALDVVLAPEGEKRDDAIREWCETVWNAYRESHETIATLVQYYLSVK